MPTVHDCKFELIDHPAYSPNLALSNYILFANIKNHLAGNLYQADYDVISAVEDFFRVRRRTSSPLEFKHCNTDRRSVWTTKKIVLKNISHLIKSQYCMLIKL